MTELQKVLSTAIKHKKFATIGYLTAMYNTTQLAELQNECEQAITLLNAAIINKKESDLNLTQFEAFANKAFLEGQVVFIRRAKKHLDGIHEQQARTLEGGIFEFDLRQN